MSQVYSNEGLVQLADDLFNASARENWTLKLFKNNVTPAIADTAATYTECDFDGYAGKTLTRSRSGSTWLAPTAVSPSGSPAWTSRATVAHTEYGASPQVFSCTGSTGNTVYGYYIVGATSGKLICAELFASPRTLANGDTLSITPTFEAG